MFVSFFQELLAYAEANNIGAEDSDTFVQIPNVAAGNRVNMTIAPVAPYAATIIHRISFGNILAGVFQLWSGQKGRTYHAGVISPDVIGLGITTWLVTTSDAPLMFDIQNIDVLNHYFECYLWHINVYSYEELNELRGAVTTLLTNTDVVGKLDELIGEVKRVPLTTENVCER